MSPTNPAIDIGAIVREEAEKVSAPAENTEGQSETEETVSPDAEQAATPEEADLPAVQEEESGEQTLLDPSEYLSDIEDATLRAAMEAKLKNMNRAFTQKTQELASARKRWEQYNPILESFERNPEATIKTLAEQYGIQVAQQPGQEEADYFLNGLKEYLGEDAANQLKPVFEQFAKQLIDSRLQPIQQAEQQRIQQENLRKIESTMNSFTESHPDWRDYETTMNDVAARLLQGDHETVMKACYLVATEAELEKRAAQKVAQKIQKSARKVPEKGSTVSTDKVKESPPDTKDIRKLASAAWEAAKSGTRW